MKEGELEDVEIGVFKRVSYIILSNLSLRKIHGKSMEKRENYS